MVTNYERIKTRLKNLIMLMIRNEQIKILETASALNFEGDLVQHIAEFTPLHYQVIGEDGTREVVRLGIKQAKKYDFTNRGPIQFYIESMFMFGSYFDTDPQYPWADETLNDPKIDDQMERADILFDRMQEYLQSVSGPDNRYALQAFNAISATRSESTPPLGSDFEREIIQRLMHIYPQKCVYVGQSAIQTLIKEGIRNAEACSIATDSGVGLFIGLMFALGHGFAADPQFPWVSTTLNNPLITDLDKKIERLRSKSFTYLDHVLKYFGQV